MVSGCSISWVAVHLAVNCCPVFLVRSRTNDLQSQIFVRSSLNGPILGQGVDVVVCQFGEFHLRHWRCSLSRRRRVPQQLSGLSVTVKNDLRFGLQELWGWGHFGLRFLGIGMGCQVQGQVGYYRRSVSHPLPSGQAVVVFQQQRLHWSEM